MELDNPPGAEGRKRDATEYLATRAKSRAAKKKRRAAITRGTEVTQLAGGCGLAWFLVLSMKIMTYLNKHTAVQRQLLEGCHLSEPAPLPPFLKTWL